MINIGIVGCGYWGPNLLRNFITCPSTEVLWACDIDKNRLKNMVAPYPAIKTTTDFHNILNDERVNGIVIATPVHTHYSIAKASLESRKHVLVEKPLASSIEQGKELVQISKEKNVQLMCDHTFCYTGMVKKIKDYIDSGYLGNILYYDSVRINLGLFQEDINVVWDLATHDLSILDHLFDEKPVYVSAHGACHSGNDLENIAYVSIGYNNNFIANLHVNWLSPVKIRRFIIGGSEKMLVWNDMDPDEKIKIYDKGIIINHVEQEERKRLLVSCRSGDMYAPQFDQTEPLSLMVKEFAACIDENRSALTDGNAGLRILSILEATQKSIKADGANINIEYVKEI